MASTRTGIRNARAFFTSSGTVKYERRDYSQNGQNPGEETRAAGFRHWGHARVFSHADR